MELGINECEMINLLNKFQPKDFLQYLIFTYIPMFYDTPLKYPQEVPAYSSLPNIHPESFDCIVRSEAPNKGSLYVSNLEGAQSPDVLKKLKVTSVLTCAEGYRLDHSEELIPNYKYFPLSQNPIFNLQEYFHESTDFLINALSKSNCFVHCLTGQNKSIAVVLAYLIKNYSMGLEDALAYVKRKRKLVNLNSTYTSALNQFALSLKNPKTHTNQTRNYTLTYKTQNSQFDNHSAQLQSAKSSLSQAHPSKNSQINQSRAEPLKNTAVTFNNKQKLQTHASKFSSNHHSRYQTRSPQIHSNPNSKDLSNHSRLQNHIEKSKTQASKILTEKKSRHASFSLDHKEAMHFDQIFSSAHQNYIGVKRQQKNSSMSFKKQKGNTINLFSNQHNSQFLEPERNIDFLKVSKELSKSRASQSRQSENKNNLRTQRSEKKSQNNSRIVENNSRMNTKRSQISQNNCSQLRILNPQNGEANCYRLQGDKKSSLRMKSRQSNASLSASEIEYENDQVRTESDQLELSKILSPGFELGESRREYFSAVNEELNSNVKEICSSFESEIANCRIKYQNRLRQLVEPVKSKKSTECGSPVIPIY